MYPLQITNTSNVEQAVPKLSFRSKFGKNCLDTEEKKSEKMGKNGKNVYKEVEDMRNNMWKNILLKALSIKMDLA